MSGIILKFFMRNIINDSIDITIYSMEISVLYSKNGEFYQDLIKIAKFERTLLEYKCHHNGLKHFLFKGFLVVIPQEKWDFIIFWNTEQFKSIIDLSNTIDGDFIKESMPTVRNYNGVSNDQILQLIYPLVK